MRALKEIRVNRVAIYIRWSTEDQGEGTTLDVQSEACKSYILSQGWGVNPDLMFVDDGISGGVLDRPALNRLRAQVRAEEIDCIVVYKLDRLSRSVVDMVRLVLDEWDGLCYVKSAREPIDTLTPTGKMFFYQLMSFAEWERNVIKERTFSGKLRRAQEGKNPGFVAAYGYRLGPNAEFVLEPGEAAVVQLMFKLYLSGLGARLVAARLTELGHPSPTGKRWDPGSVARMLSNPIYTGTMVYGRETEVRGKTVKADKPHVIKEGVAPAIIDEATFQAVQKVKTTRPGFGRGRGSGRSLSSQSLLTGVLKCRCGRSYVGNLGAAKDHYRYYACSGASGKGTSVCAAGRIRQDLLDEMIVGALVSQYGGQDSKTRLLSGVTRQLGLAEQEARAAYESASRELERVTEREVRLKALFLEDKLTIDEFRELKTDLTQQIATIKERQLDASRRLEEATHALRDRRHLVERLDLINQWGTLQQHERKQLIMHFISHIQVYRDLETKTVECSISWRWSSESSPTPEVQVFSHPRSTDHHRAAIAGRARDSKGRLVAVAQEK